MFKVASAPASNLLRVCSGSSSSCCTAGSVPSCCSWIVPGDASTCPPPLKLSLSPRDASELHTRNAKTRNRSHDTSALLITIPEPVPVLPGFLIRAVINVNVQQVLLGLLSADADADAARPLPPPPPPDARPVTGSSRNSSRFQDIYNVRVDPGFLVFHTIAT